MTPTTSIQISVRDVPDFAELYGAVHALLLDRLLHCQDGVSPDRGPWSGTPGFLDAINRLVVAHDAIADKLSEREATAK